MAVTEQTVHLVCHTERMLRVLAARPDHPRKAEYDATIAGYRATWQGIGADDRELIAAATTKVHDQTADSIAAAVAALEV